MLTDGLWIIVMFLSALILTAPIHFIAETLLHFSESVLIESPSGLVSNNTRVSILTAPIHFIAETLMHFSESVLIESPVRFGL